MPELVIFDPDDDNISNSSLPMRIDDDLFSAAFGSMATRTQPGQSISLLPYLINPVGTGTIIATEFSNIDPSEVVINQESRSMVIEKPVDEGEYSFKLSVVQ